MHYFPFLLFLSILRYLLLACKEQARFLSPAFLPTPATLRPPPPQHTHTLFLSTCKRLVLIRLSVHCLATSLANRVTSSEALAMSLAHWISARLVPLPPLTSRDISAINRAMRLAAAMMSLPWREARHRVSSAHTLAKLGNEVEAKRRKEGACCSSSPLEGEKRIHRLFLGDTDNRGEVKRRVSQGTHPGIQWEWVRERQRERDHWTENRRTWILIWEGNMWAPGIALNKHFSISRLIMSIKWEWAQGIG